MKWIFTPVLCFFLCIAIHSHAQPDSASYADYQGSYLISTPSFPVNDVTIYRKDSTLAFNAGGSKGILKHTEGDYFLFIRGDHEGTVTFKRNELGKVCGILISMDGEIYEGTKKILAGKDRK